MRSRYSYQHPGYAFLNEFGSLQGEEDLFHYVEFLRQESDQADAIAIDLSKIYQRFCMPEPLKVPLGEQQGILLDTYKGIILIKEDDPIVRQRFTESHELMELLFDAQTDVQQELDLPSWDHNRKEQLCDLGAAELLMPRSSFVPRLNKWGLSIDSAKKLSATYKTSLLATLTRMVELSNQACALVIWRYALKPTEKRRNFTIAPSPKMRIQWRKASPSWQPFIPKDKSVESPSLIIQAQETGEVQTGQEEFVWGGQSVECQVEAMPVMRQGDPMVVSLLRLRS